MILNFESDCKILLINTYLKHQQDASDDFYDEYFIINPTVAFYNVWVKDISVNSSTNPTGTITFISTPFVSAHWNVGIDEITFSADYVGNVELVEFKHIISYPLPDHLKSLIKKPIPGEYKPL